MAARPCFESFHAPRRRLGHLRADLAALALSDDEIDDLPLCEPARALTGCDAAGLGSFYVMEGSTLGGQVIGRALADSDWLPTTGLSYFNPYGARTGEMWRSFKAWADEHPAAAEREQVARGAERTFDLLTDWLVS